MEVLRIGLDSSVFQSFLPVNQKIWNGDQFNLNCTPKIENEWVAPEVYVHNPRLEEGNFFHLCSGGFVVDLLALSKLREFFEMAGQLLPVNHRGITLNLVNVLECVNCLNDEKTEWVYGKTTGSKIRIKKYAFHKERLSESTLFKIPETSAGEILTLSGIKESEDEFKSAVERAGLKGLIFEKLWSDEE